MKTWTKRATLALLALGAAAFAAGAFAALTVFTAN